VARAGHGGTLDPLATGVLPICLDAGTKLAPYLLADDKAYEADGVLGVVTDTLDRDGQILSTHPVTTSEAALRAAIARRLGEQEQVPPMFSAIKQGGVPLYKRARAGEHVAREPRRIRIDRLELLAFDPPRFRIAVACSKGTYVRSLVADLGADVGCGAHLAELRRTRSGRFEIARAVAYADLATLDLATVIVPLTEVTGLPTICAPASLVGPALAGVQLTVEAWGLSEAPVKGQRFQLVTGSNTLVAIVHFDAGKTLYDRVFPELSGA